MTARDFRELAAMQWKAGRLLCVGLDSDAHVLKTMFPRSDDIASAQSEFNKRIVDSTSDLVGAFKPNSAFYEASGAEGLAALRETVRYIKSSAPDVPVILDAKRADIGNTNGGYVDYAFNYLMVDAITVHPYLGQEALRPFLDHANKGIFVLCRTSNPGAGELQDLVVEASGGRRLFEVVAEQVVRAWNANGNCGLVVGSTYPDELKTVRGIAEDLPILIPGIGSQGGDLQSSVLAGARADGGGIFLNAARSVIFASTGDDYAASARAEAGRLHDSIVASR